MGLQFHRLRWSGIALLFFIVASCRVQEVKKPEGEKNFFQETSRLERLAGEDSKPSVRAESHLQLAFLYVNHRNPQLDYNRALQEMENYLSLTPGREQTDDLQNWLTVLKEVEKLRTGAERLQKANKSLRDEASSLKGTIERLKNLDRQMEERRSLTK